ncbi:uncharacterized protein LOC131219032 [Magnolia sinica]|uniref:uncharacterized protein LOC131219032 n=1 Tax=Magnolia sinica TaxID=86752 RepID=UPI002659ADBB|nr:uncharacterized protein LOC131219032 [Magnolia sinica]
MLGPDRTPRPLIMEPAASSSRPPDQPSPARFNPTQPFADRIIRALRHHLRLLHRSDADFFVLGATGNVYTVTLSVAPSCTCPDRTTPCKHILFVLLRVLGLSLDDTCLRRRTLRPCQLSRLLRTPVSLDTLAGPRARERFHQLFSESRGSFGLPHTIELPDDSTCPVCMEQMRKEERLVACAVCRNSLHDECFLKWKRSRGRRAASCVICRARWRERKELDGYMNLAAYVSNEDDGAPGDRASCAA